MDTTAANVLHAARAVCHNPAEANITRLAMMLDAYDQEEKHMRITLEQYPGFVQNLETIASVDLSDNNPALLARLALLLNAALENVARALSVIGEAEEEE